ncbi:MAG: phosphatidylglycerophosphatase A [Deltaproteobacteria bacterium]|nr:phosphatidylglycerophosphatase A [Deltaproteobacteria bacterium]
MALSASVHLRHTPAHWLVGLAPGPSGTYAAALSTVLFFLIESALRSGGFFFFVGTTLLGFFTAGRAEKVYGHDGRAIVVDEVAGQALTLLFVPLTWPWLVAGFGLFRLFDIVKPWPIGRLEAAPGGVGVMSDDLAAGVMAGVVLALVRLAFF